MRFTEKGYIFSFKVRRNFSKNIKGDFSEHSLISTRAIFKRATGSLKGSLSKVGRFEKSLNRVARNHPCAVHKGVIAVHMGVITPSSVQKGQFRTIGVTMKFW
jgi:hypothetical protein